MNSLALLGLVVLGLIALVFAIISMSSSRKSLNKINELESLIESYSKNLNVLGDSAISMGKDVAELQGELRELQTATPHANEELLEDSVLRAQAMLDQGMTSSEIAKEIGIPDHEVQLMQAVRRSHSVTLNPEVSTAD